MQLTCQLGLTQSLYYFLPRGGKKRGAYIAQTFLSLAVLGVLFGAPVLLGAASRRWLGDGSLASLRAPLATFGGLTPAPPRSRAPIVSEGRIARAALAYVISDGTRAAALVLGAKYGGPAGLFWAAAAVAGARVRLPVRHVEDGAVAAPARGCQAAARLRAAVRRRVLPLRGAALLSQYAVSASFDAATFALFAVASFHMPMVDIVFTPLSDVMIVQVGKAQHAGDARDVGGVERTVQRLAAILFPGARARGCSGRRAAAPLHAQV